MLEIVNNLKPFFENCYARIGVREYAMLVRVSPPTASSILKQFEREGLLTKEKERNYILFTANQKSMDFVMLSRIYWQNRLRNIIEEVSEESQLIILFGSLAKAETKPDSDIDLAIIGSRQRKLTFAGRDIQALWFDSIDEIKPKGLKENILNGHVISGSLKL